MIFLQDRAEPIDSLLARQLGNAQREIANIPADKIGGNIPNLIETYVKLFTVKTVALEKSIAKIDPEKPTSVEVTWKVTGNTSLIGLADSDGKSIDLKKSAQTRINALLNYAFPIAGNEQLQREIKDRIASITADLTSHFTKLNIAVKEINAELRGEIPKFVEERVKFINRNRAAEDFLNS